MQAAENQEPPDAHVAVYVVGAGVVVAGVAVGVAAAVLAGVVAAGVVAVVSSAFTTMVGCRWVWLQMPKREGPISVTCTASCRGAEYSL